MAGALRNVETELNEVRATRTILAGALLEGQRIPVHPLAAKSVGVPILPQLGQSALQHLAQYRTIKCIDIGSAYRVLFTYIKLLVILVQLEFLLDLSSPGPIKTLLKKGSQMFDFPVVMQIVPSLCECAEAI